MYALFFFYLLETSLELKENVFSIAALSGGANFIEMDKVIE